MQENWQKNNYFDAFSAKATKSRLHYHQARPANSQYFTKTLDNPPRF